MASTQKVFSVPIGRGWHMVYIDDRFDKLVFTQDDGKKPDIDKHIKEHYDTHNNSTTESPILDKT